MKLGINLDKNPSTGIHDADFYAVISDAEYLQGHFNGKENYVQVEDVTVGKAYHIHKVETYGDVADYYFINDAGKERRLGSFFFEPDLEPDLKCQ